MRLINLKTITFGIRMVHTKQKKCSKCGKVKDLESGFYKDLRKKDGLRSTCKTCHRKTVSQYRKKDPEKTKKQYRKYYKKHAEEIREQKQKYYEEHKEEIREQKQKQDKEREENKREWKQKYRKDHAEEKRVSGRKYYKEHIEEMRERGRKYYKEYAGRQQSERHKQSVISLEYGYLCKQITKRAGLKRYQITPELIEAKREQLLFYRELKTLKQEVQNGIT